MKPDRVLWSKELFSARAMAQVLDAPLASIGGEAPEAVRVPVSATGAGLTIAPPFSDWTDADQVVLYLYVPEEVRPNAWLRIDCGSTTPGLAGNDYMQCYYRYLHSGWGRVEFPYENMLIFGIPDAWRHVTEVTLQLQGEGEGEYLVGSISIEHRERAEGPRMTDEELFAALDLDRPGLEQVREDVAAGNLGAAREALIAYMRRRESPKHPYATGPTPVAGHDTDDADRICNHYILDQQLSAEIDWRANPIGYLEWMHAYNRHGFMMTLLDAYLATANDTYAAKLDYLLSTWFRASPVPISNNGGGDPAWETLSAACRIAVGRSTWPRIWAALQESSAFRPETRIDMLKSFYEHAEHLIIYPTGHNWLVAESAAVATVGMLFPEFRRAEEWRRVGWERLEREMLYQVYPDGAQFELSPGYHRMCADIFANAYELAKPNDYAVSNAFAERLEAMYDYTMHVTRPDGTRPSLNDAGALDVSTAPELRRGHTLFGRPEYLYVASEGDEGVAPSARSQDFPYGGHYVMRSGWQRDDLWALVDAGPYGAAHQHEDKLSLELYAHGTRFVVDPGIASYLDDPLTHHFRATAAHNTAMVDGRGQDRRTTMPRSRYRVDEPESALWGSSEHLDYVWAEYADGYQGLPLDSAPVHGRLVLFWKPHFWIVWDALRGAGEHELSVLWHWSPMLVQQDASGVVRSNRLGLANLELLPVTPPDDIAIVCGDQNPVQGWLTVSEPARQVVPAPVAIYHRRGALPLAVGVLAAPYLSGTSSGFRAEPLGGVAVEGVDLYLATSIQGSQEPPLQVLFAPVPSTITLDDVRAHAQGLVVQRSPDGDVRYVAALSCTRLKVGDRLLSDTTAADALIEYSGSDKGGTRRW